MLLNAKKLERCELRARDGKIGHVDDLLFDDRHWRLRYLVADTGTWLNSRLVLISPVALGAPEWERHMIPVDLTREQVRQSPPLESVQPISREHEALLSQYYSWPMYWAGGDFLDGGLSMPIMPVDLEAAGGGERARFPSRDAADQPAAAHATGTDEPQPRSMRNVSTYSIEATDGLVGHVDDFLLDERTWDVRYLVVDTRQWLPGKKVLIAPQWINEVGWDDARVHVGLSRARIKNSPAFNPSEPLGSEYTTSLHDHYGRPRHSSS